MKPDDLHDFAEIFVPADLTRFEFMFQWTVIHCRVNLVRRHVATRCKSTNGTMVVEKCEDIAEVEKNRANQKVLLVHTGRLRFTVIGPSGRYRFSTGSYFHRVTMICWP